MKKPHINFFWKDGCVVIGTSSGDGPPYQVLIGESGSESFPDHFPSELNDRIRGFFNAAKGQSSEVLRRQFSRKRLK